MERTIGVFGEEMLLWICALRQSPKRPPAQHVHQQANLLLDELGRSKLARELPAQAVDDGMFAIAALLDELAMALPDLRPVWASHPLQAVRPQWATNNAGNEVFQRLERVKSGPKPVLATYATVLGLGFQGRYGLPGADRYQLAQIRRELGALLGVDPDRDWGAGVLRPPATDGPSALVTKAPWYRSVGFGRALAIGMLVLGAAALAGVIVGNWVNGGGNALKPPVDSGARAPVTRGR